MADFDDTPRQAPFSMVFDPGVPSSQVPYRYQILRERARLVTCCYWREPEDTRTLDEQLVEDSSNNVSLPEPFIYEFTSIELPPQTLTDSEDPTRTTEEVIAYHRPTPAEENLGYPVTMVAGWAHESTPSFYIKPVKSRESDESTTLMSLSVVLIDPATEVPTRCIKTTDAAQYHQGEDGFPPCNGAKTECPFYTGPLLKYINDEDVYIGQEIRAEQVQELRSFMKNWSMFADPEDAWNRTFEIPDIFAREHNPPDEVDPPVVSSEEVDGVMQPLSQMTRVHWDHESNDIVQTKVVSTPEGTEERTENGIISPPSFYTLINNLGTAELDAITIQFPPHTGDLSEDSDSDTQHIIEFTYEHAAPFSDILYMAGTTKAQVSVFVVNVTMNQDFPFTEEGLERTEEVTPKIEEYIKKYFSTSSTTGAGFRITKADSSGLWEEFFVPLIPGENKIVVLTQLDGEWNYARAKIIYKMYHMEFIQQGYHSSLTDGQIPFLSYITDAPALDPVVFKGYQMGSTAATVDSVYQFYVQERDLLDQCTYADKPNLRTFDYTYEEVTEDVRFFKLGKCNQFMCEITERDIPTVAPMGVDRSMEISEIKFHLSMDPDSSHGESNETVVQMRVVPFRGRNVEGIAIPVRFFKVEPIGNVDIRKADLDTSRMEVKYYIFRGEPLRDEEVEGRTEATLSILASFQDSDFDVTTVGGLSVFSLSADTESSISLMKMPSIDGNTLTLDSPGKSDMSYVVQYKSPETGNIIGRKWLYGVAEVSKFWARDIEIRYSWCSSFSVLARLLPEYRKFGHDVSFGGLGDHVEPRAGVCRRSLCGSHEVSHFGEGGPSFYPYDACSDPMYHITDVARWILQPVPDAEPIDEKYRAPDKATYRTLDHHLFGFLRPDCFMEWSLGTILSYGGKFNGWSRERGPISPFIRPELWLTYIIQGWKLPPLGNRGREAVRIYKTMNYQQFIYRCSNLVCGFCVRFGWLPALPYASPPDFYVDSAPRSILDQTTKGYPIERKKWDEIFYVRNTIEPYTQSRPAQPVQYPRQGFHPSFRKPEYLWAWQDREEDLERAEDYISGLKITKPTPQVDGEFQGYVGRDMFFRPINFHPPEPDGEAAAEGSSSTIKIFLVPEEYESPGVYVNRAHFKLGEEGIPLYFDEYSGAIQADNGSANPLKQVYAMDQNEMVQSGINPPTNDLYPDRVGRERFNYPLPEDLEGLDVYIETGNLIPSIEQVDTYLLTGDILGEEEGARWAGFFPGLSVTQIVPEYLPRTELDLSEKEDLFPSIKITDYPNINPGVSLDRNFSNHFIPDSRARILGGERGVMDWIPVYKANPPGAEQIEGFVITIVFDRLVMLSKLIFQYEVYGGEAQGSPLPVPPAVPASVDPSVRIVVSNTQSSFDIILKDKPQYRGPPHFLPTGLSPFGRTFTFGEEEVGSVNDQEVFDNRELFDRIEITIGPRNPETGFRVRLIDVFGKFIEEAHEDLTIKEKKYNVEVMDSLPSAPFNYPAEDDYENEEWFKMGYAEDVSDMLEFQGIAEFWQPARASLNKTRKVGRLGKLGRDWANGWDSLDVQIYLGEIERKSQYANTRHGGDVIRDHESRQRELMSDALEEALSDGIDEEEWMMYISTSDRTFYKFLQQASSDEIYLPYESDTVVFQGGVADYKNNLENIIGVASGELPPGWQAEGFWACLGNRSKTRTVTPRACNNLGGGTYGTRTPEWNTTHGVCGKNVGDPSNSDQSDYFGGLSIGDLGFFAARRLALSGGDYARTFADAGGSLHQTDGHLGSIAGDSLEELADIRAAQAREGAYSAGFPQLTQDLREARE